MRSLAEIEKERERLATELAAIQRERERLGPEIAARLDELRGILRSLDGWHTTRDDVEARIQWRIAALEQWRH